MVSWAVKCAGKLFSLVTVNRRDTRRFKERVNTHLPMPNSQLERISDWAPLAQEARYRAAELAKLTRVSLRQLERFFMEHFRRPPQDWLDELRLIKAAVLLVSGHRVKEIAPTLGFRQVSHFSRRFVQYFGCRPIQFMRVHDQRLAERKKKFAAWFPNESIPPEWLADPTLTKPWDRLFQRRRQSAS